METDSHRTDDGRPLPAAAVAALTRGNKIAAIKILRRERDIGLKEAKDIVDDYVAGQPALADAFAAAQTRGKWSVLVMALIIALAVLARWLFVKH